MQTETSSLSESSMTITEDEDEDEEEEMEDWRDGINEKAAQAILDLQASLINRAADFVAHDEASLAWDSFVPQDKLMHDAT